MVTEKQTGQTKKEDDEREVTTEQRYIEFPPRYAEYGSITINGITYINKGYMSPSDAFIHHNGEKADT